MTEEQRKKLTEVMTGLSKTMMELEPEDHIGFFSEFNSFTRQRLLEDADRFDKASLESAERAKQIRGFVQEKTS